MTAESGMCPVTGIGLVTPLGQDPVHLLRALHEGRCAVGALPEGVATRVESSRYGAAIAEVPSPPGPSRGARFLDRSIRLSLASVTRALEAAGLGDPEERADMGVVSASWLPSIESCQDFIDVYDRDGVDAVSPMQFPNCAFNAGAAQVGMRLGLHGPNGTISSGVVTGLSALEYAGHWLASGMVRRVAVHACQEITSIALEGRRRLGLLARPHGGRPPRCRPFDRDRDGTVLGEAAVTLVLEDADSARRRSVDPLGYVSAPWIESLPAESVAGSRRIGSARAGGRVLERAVNAAGLEIEDIDHVIPTASGDPEGDALLARSLHAALGAHVPISAPTGALGNLLGAASLLNTALSLAVMDAEELFPTLHHRASDRDAALDIVSKARAGAYRTGLVATVDPTGACGAVVVRGRA